MKDLKKIRGNIHSLDREFFLKCTIYLAAVLLLVMVPIGAAFAQATPAVVSSTGYIQGAPQTVHTTTAFSSIGATALVAFVSSHPTWPQPVGLPVSISGVSDNVGNTWTTLTGPTQWDGSTYSQISAIYYVKTPITSTAQTFTVNLTNPAPMVIDIFAVSGSDITSQPIFSAITDPGTGLTNTSVTTDPITVANKSLLVAWAKNELDATAIALDGYTLDSSSTSFLWSETQTAPSAGSYQGQFTYSTAIGWQAAIVGLQPLAVPVAYPQGVTTEQNTPLGITLTGFSPQGLPLTYSVVTGPTHGTLSGVAPSLTYTPDTGYLGPDVFTFKANDGTTDSNVASVQITVQGPVVVSSSGYINGNALTSHITNAFSSSGATTLVAFVSTCALWDGQAVSISGLSDSVGNTWNVLTGPTEWTGTTCPLLSTIYFVNTPLTSATHTLTVTLTNPAPLVADVFAVAGSDTTGPPIFSAINDPGPGGTSASVTTAAITVPSYSLLLSWVKNDTAATATALGGYTLDPSSTSYLWSETQTALSAGSYAGQFQYSAPIGWQTAIVGVKPTAVSPPPPSITSNPANPTNQTSASFSFTDTQAGVSYLCQLDASTFSACTSPQAYAGPLSQGSHTFSVEAQDAALNVSTATSFTWTINTTPPPAPSITSNPANPTNQTSASFSFTDTQAGVSYLCQLDASTFSACTSPQAYAGPLSQGSHTFSVEAQDPALNVSTATSFTWTINTTPPPAPTITSNPANPTTQTSASFSFTDTQAGVSYLCQLDASTFSACTSPQAYAGPLSQGSHTFSVEAQDPALNVSTATSFTWTINTAPPAPTITSNPANPTNQTSASFSFSDTQAGVSYLCQLDGSAFGACVSPQTYSGLSQGSHTFAVEAKDTAGNLSTAASFTWTINTTPPPAPTITSKPANPTNQTSASFSFTDTQAGVNFLCQLDGSAFSACTSPQTYSGPLSEGKHTFAVKAQDAAGNRSAAASFSWTIDTTPPPAPTITSNPANPTGQTSASFSFSDTQAGVKFLCQLDGSAFSVCSSGKTYSGLGQGSHTFAVEAQDKAGNQSSATSFTWTINTTLPPAPTITSKPANPTNQTSASFSFTDTQAGVNFLCQLDGSAFSACTNPQTYSGPLSEGKHTFAVKAQDAIGNKSSAVSYTWTIDTTPPPTPTITANPANPTNQTSASFSFSDTQAGVKFLCQLDGSAFSVCSSGKTYSGLGQGSHTFAVEAQDKAGNQSSATSFTWTID